MTGTLVIDLILDNYSWGATKEVFVSNASEYYSVLKEHFAEHQDNFASVYPCNGGKGYIIEFGANDSYYVYEVSNPSKRDSFELDDALEHVYKEVNKS